MAMNESELKQLVEGGHGIAVIRGSKTCRDWNGIHYKAGLSAKNVNAQKLSMNVATIPPGGVAHAHIHVDFEVMLYILKGRVRHEYGAGLKKSIDNEVLPRDLKDPLSLAIGCFVLGVVLIDQTL